MSNVGGPHVELGMYPFESVAWAWAEIWAAVHRRLPWTPETLTRSGDIHARWHDSDCLLTQVCGGPFAAVHHNEMRLIGTFTLDIAEADGDHYRSVLLSPDARTLDELVLEEAHAVANSDDSLSGWISLLAATVGPGCEWPGRVTFTGSHEASLMALVARKADIASIDSWSLALLTAERPELVASLHRVALGPSVPTPAIAARRSVTAERVDELRQAFVDAVADPNTGPARHALRIVGFADNRLDDYLALLPLVLASRPDRS